MSAGAGRVRSATVDLATSVGAVDLPNPVLTASGTAGLGTELAPYFDLASIGATVVKSLSVTAWAGNPAPRLWPLEAGMLNSVGLQNPGISVWSRQHLPDLIRAGARVVVSIWASSAAGYREAAAAVASVAAASGPGADGRAGGPALDGPAMDAPAAAGPPRAGSGLGRIVAVEANISCPNVEDRERMFAHSEAGTAAAVAAAVDGLADSGLPLWVKLSPNVTDLAAIGAAAIGAGADGLTLVNTLMGLAIDPATGRARLGNGGGGLSGPALHAVAVRAVFECRRAFPAVGIVGVGGIASGCEAAEMLAAGADAVQVGTATFAEPRAPARILAELRSWCGHHAIDHLPQLRGRAHAHA